MGKSPGEQGTAITSRFAHDPEMSAMVRAFVEDLPQRMESLCQAWEHARLDDLRLLTQRLKGSSSGHGFTPIGSAASKVVREIDTLQADNSFDDLLKLEEDFRALLALCERAR
jgi:Hpt domain